LENKERKDFSFDQNLPINFVPSDSPHQVPAFADGFESIGPSPDPDARRLNGIRDGLTAAGCLVEPAQKADHRLLVIDHQSAGATTVAESRTPEFDLVTLEHDDFEPDSKLLEQPLDGPIETRRPIGADDE